MCERLFLDTDLARGWCLGDLEVKLEVLMNGRLLQSIGHDALHVRTNSGTVFL